MLDQKFSGPSTIWREKLLVGPSRAIRDYFALRLISYIHWHKDDVLTCFVGDRPEDCYLVLFSDASFAGDLKDSKSTSGAYLCLVGPNTFVPITWLCKKQGAVSHSSSEAEVIALDTCVRIEGIPALMLWDLVIAVFSPTTTSSTRELGLPAQGNLLQDKPRSIFDVDFVPPSMELSSGRARLILLEDNDAVIKMTVKRRSPNMRHVARTHRTNLGSSLLLELAIRRRDFSSRAEACQHSSRWECMVLTVKVFAG